MGTEFSDVIVILKPKEEWTSAETKEELVEKIHNALDSSGDRSVIYTADRIEIQ